MCCNELHVLFIKEKKKTKKKFVNYFTCAVEPLLSSRTKPAENDDGDGIKSWMFAIQNWKRQYNFPPATMRQCWNRKLFIVYLLNISIFPGSRYHWCENSFVRDATQRGAIIAHLSQRAKNAAVSKQCAGWPLNVNFFFLSFFDVVNSNFIFPSWISFWILVNLNS